MYKVITTENSEWEEFNKVYYSNISDYKSDQDFFDLINEKEIFDSKISDEIINSDIIEQINLLLQKGGEEKQDIINCNKITDDWDYKAYFFKSDFILGIYIWETEA